MPTNRAELKRAIHTLLNDVVEQCFRHLIHHPQQSDELNKLIKDTTDEINYMIIKVDAHNYKNGTSELNNHYQTISKELHKKSLQLMSRFQQIRKAAVNVAGE